MLDKLVSTGYHSGMVRRKKTKASEQVRRIIADCGISRYRIWQETGISQAVLSRFMNGKGWLSIDVFDKLADCIGLDVVVRKGVKKRKKG